jgi:hypothetical protein
MLGTVSIVLTTVTAAEDKVAPRETAEAKQLTFPACRASWGTPAI